MRIPLIAAGLLAACASSPAVYCAHDVVGHYRMSDGPEICLELEFHPGGACVVTSSNWGQGMMRDSWTGYWRIEGDEVAVDVDSSEFRLMVGAGKLALRRWDGHVYLVPPRNLSWFDEYGPMHEFCFSQEGAPLFLDPRSSPKRKSNLLDHRP